MLFGPFPEFLIERLRAKLDEVGAKYQVFLSEEALNEYRAKTKQRPPTNIPTYPGAESLLYIEIEKSALLAVKSDLEQMGAVVVDRDFNPGFDANEYLCPKCDFVSATRGRCPKHALELVEFSDLAKLKSADTGKLFYRVILVVVVVLGGYILWYNSK